VKSVDSFGVSLEAMVQLFDAMPDVVFFAKDRGARYLAVNQALVERVGAAGRGALLGKTAAEVFEQPMADAFHEQDVEVMASGQALREVLELHLYGDGTQGWCLTSKTAVRGDDGTVVGLFGVSRDVHMPAAEGRGYNELAAAVAHVREHYGEPLRVEDLTELCGLSLYQFEQRMKRVFQMTAGQYIVRTRIQVACDRLRRGGEAIVDIALGCGFSDQSAFSRQFRATVGCTPSEYRRRSAG